MLTAFFVATEFAIVKIRPTRIDYLIEQGNNSAKYVKKILDDLDRYLSACQLGITVTALGLGWLGEPTVVRLLNPLFEKMDISPSIASILAFVIAFMLVTYLHVVIGELAPKTIAIQKAEAISLMIARPLIFFYKVMYPFIWLLNGSAWLLLRLFGVRPVDTYDKAASEEELRLILSESYKSGEINKAEMTYVTNIFEFDETIAKEVMVPRTEIVCFYKENSLQENLDTVYDGQYTRYPVAVGDKDNIIGLINIKELFTGKFNGEDTNSIDEYIRPIIHVSEATPIRTVLVKMQKERIHMAIVNDEYGGTAGLITVEDILEEIVGDIRDEFDDEEQKMYERINNETLIVSGKLLIEDLNELDKGLNIDDEDVDTIGGWLFKQNIDANKGTVVELENYRFIVLEMDGYHIKKIKIVKRTKKKQDEQVTTKPIE